MKEIICVDLDGVLAEDGQWNGVEHFGKVIDGAKEFLENLRQHYDVVIYTCRFTEGINGIEKAGLLRNRVRDWLDENELPYDEIFIGQGKPIATAYVDDRGINCSPQYNKDAFQKVLFMLGI